MEPEEQYRLHVLKSLVGSTPSGFWRGVQDRARSLYLDSFSSVHLDPQLNDSQRPSMLWQYRHFKMEWLLCDEARQHGVPASPNLIVENRCQYALAGPGPVRMTQKYVRQHGDMPSPAKFRKQLAAVNAFSRSPELAFGDEPRELFMPSEINGIILHSPIGPKFREDHQGLGSIGFYVPYDDFNGWAVRLTFGEIIAAYEQSAAQKDRVTPTLKVIPKTGELE